MFTPTIIPVDESNSSAFFATKIPSHIKHIVIPKNRPLDIQFTLYTPTFKVVDMIVVLETRIQALQQAQESYFETVSEFEDFNFHQKVVNQKGKLINLDKYNIRISEVDCIYNICIAEVDSISQTITMHQELFNYLEEKALKQSFSNFDDFLNYQQSLQHICFWNSVLSKRGELKKEQELLKNQQQQINVLNEEKEVKSTFDNQKRLKQCKDKSYKVNTDYFVRCCYYLDNGIGFDVTNPMTEDEMKEIIIQAHQKLNNELLHGTIHPGCRERGIDCSLDCTYCGLDSVKGRCYWEYDERRCVCGNYKGFVWDTENVDWLHDINLDSKQYVGYQKRLW